MKHWVFDLDGTLIDSYALYWDNLGETFRKFDLSLSVVDDEKARKFFARDLLALYLPEKHVNEAYEHLLKINTERTNEVKAIDGILEMLRELRASPDVKVSVWTGRDKVTAQLVLANTGIQPLTHHFRSGGCVTNNKPNPEGLLQILSESKSKHEEVLMIGDSDFDILGAKAAKVKVALVSWAHADNAHLASQSDFHFTDVSDFRNWNRQHLV